MEVLCSVQSGHTACGVFAESALASTLQTAVPWTAELVWHTNTFGSCMVLLVPLSSWHTDSNKAYCLFCRFDMDIKFSLLKEGVNSHSLKRSSLQSVEFFLSVYKQLAGKHFYFFVQIMKTSVNTGTIKQVHTGYLLFNFQP